MKRYIYVKVYRHYIAKCFKFKNTIYGYVYADFDECLGEVDDCPEASTCINTDGDYFCSCIDGYNTVNETKSCKGKKI